MSLKLLQVATIIMAAANFGFWQHDINAGVFVFCSLTALTWRE